MQIYKNSMEPTAGRTVVSIGNFDGVHLGHQQILRRARQLADERGASLAAVTFEPHPAVILHPDKAPGILTPLACKQQFLKQLGVDCLLLITDSFNLLNLSPKDFVDRFLMSLSPCAVVEGPNFTFGYGRSGTIETLRQLGEQRGFEVHEVPYAKVTLPAEQGEAVCSSTAIRRFLEDGRVDCAARMLTRCYRLIGKTVSGRGVGRSLGFPTANIDPESQIIPAEGVYAGFAVVADEPQVLCDGGHRRPAAISIGRAKTFISDHPLLLETHILEHGVENLYGKFLAVEFVQRIRNQQRFESPEALKEQIACDCRTALSILHSQ